MNAQIHDAEVGKVYNAGVSKKQTINERKVPEFFSKPVNRKDARAEIAPSVISKLLDS